MIKQQKSQRMQRIVRIGLALLSTVVFLFCGCARKITAVAREDTEDAYVQQVVSKLGTGTAPAEVYEKVYTADRIVSVILEGFTDEASMRALADAAAERNAPVTFFISYVDASDYPATVKYIADAGCAIGCYGLNGEKNMQINSPERNARAFYQSRTAIQIAAEYTPVLFRCNGSEYTDELLELAAVCGLKAGVQPTSFLNHRSFNAYDNALNYVRKLLRGSIVSIKLGQELDSLEYGDVGEKLDEKPAVDKPPSITEESLYSDDDGLDNTVNIFSWLLDALAAEQFDVVSLDALMRSKQQGETAIHVLDAEALLTFAPESYTGIVTETPLGVQETPGVPDSYFDGAVFVGDSVSLKLESYTATRRETEPAFLGTAQFLTNQGLGVGNALWQISADSRHPSYNGVTMTIEDAIAAMGNVTRVYLMLGMNDIQFYSVEEYLNNYRTLIYLIRSKSPGVEICIQSITPGIANRTNAPSNEDIFRYDLALAQFCAEYGYPYIDVASTLRGADGSLPEGLCSDINKLGLHLNDGAAELWLRYLRTHAPSETAAVNEPAVSQEPSAENETAVDDAAAGEESVSDGTTVQP